MHEARPERLQVVYCDTRVRSSEVFTPDDGAVTLHAKGGGGTRFQPVFDMVNQQTAEQDAPKALLYFTDLVCSAGWPASRPGRRGPPGGPAGARRPPGCQ